MENVIDVTRTALSGNLLEQLSVQIRESQAATRRGIEHAVPISVAGLATHASTQPRAEALLGKLRSGNYPHADARELAQSASDADDTARLALSGNSFLSQIFGDRLSGIVDALAGQAGLSPGSAATLLGISAPIVLHAVAREANERNLDARGLSRFLADQGDRAKGVLPVQLSSTLGAAAPLTSRGESFGDSMRHRVEDYRRRHPREVERERPARGDTASGARAHERLPSRWPLIALALALLVLVILLFARRGQAPEEIGRAADKAAEETKQAASSAAHEAKQAAGEVERTPGGAERGEGEIERVAGRTTAPEQGAVQAGQAVVLAAGAGALDSYLASHAQVPQRFRLQGLEFAPASASLGSNAMLDRVAEVLRNHESARVRVEGHSDASGDRGQDTDLSRQRAASVKDYLVDHGVATERIETTGRGAEQPIASNDSAEGRAQNRRVDLIVTAR